MHGNGGHPAVTRTLVRAVLSEVPGDLPLLPVTGLLLPAALLSA
jgi:hypothetical protein